MAKQQSYQKYIYKIHSRKILQKNKNLTLSLAEMRRTKELISLADSQVLRFIDEINGIDINNINEQISNIRKRIKKLQSEVKNADSVKIKQIKTEIKSNYDELDKLQNKPDYLTVIMDNPNDIDKLDSGFIINGLKYKRLVGTSNGVKKSTIVYVSERSQQGQPIYDELCKRLENGRNPDIKLVPAKYEAYKSLACSASIPVSNPNGILVVDDVILKFNADILEINDENADESKGIEPTMEHKIAEVELDNSDGYGLITPSLAKQWSDDLKLDYVLGGCCVRNAFLKGMMFPFDFQEFADKIAHKDTVVDVWGCERNIHNVEMILPTSMLKLWDCYNSLEDYLENCNKNGYSFAVTKACPKTLDEERTLNYQFIQSYDLSNNDIEKLIAPSVSEIKEIINGDINKAILFLRGVSVTDETVGFADDDYVKALMIDSEMYKDPYVINRINNMIKRRIQDTKIGVVKVKGNYAVISGDPYALCQHIFKTNIDDDGNDIESEMGLLKAGEIYSKFWVDKNIAQVVCFRAPMSCHNNIRLVNVVSNANITYWYQYMTTVNIVNCHDAMAHSMNGFDEDGDLMFTTNNDVLINNWVDTPSIICMQRKAEKKIITDDLLRNSNKDGFGDEIGTTTNHITAMFDILSEFLKGSVEYETLMYRIQCGQLYQQNCIDRVKGIIAKPMPKSWYKRININELVNNGATTETILQAKYSNTLCADRKPYFMNYIYPQQKAKYDRYIKRTNKKCIEEFDVDFETLCKKENKTEKERNFIKLYYEYLPSSDNNCVMNRLCHLVENHFDSFVSEIKFNSNFDYSILKSSTSYSKSNFNKIKELYRQYNDELTGITKTFKEYHIDDNEKSTTVQCLNKTYRDKCIQVCPDVDELCNITLDLCYTNEKSKQFAWSVCGEQIIQNLLKRNNYVISYLVADENGDIEYCGQRFTKKQKQIGGNI